MRLPAAQRESMKTYLLSVQASTAARGALRTFVLIDGWDGPASIADVVEIPGWALEGKSVEQLASGAPRGRRTSHRRGGRDRGRHRRPTRRRATAPPGEPHPGVIARLDVLVPVADGALRIHTAQRTSCDSNAFGRPSWRLAAASWSRRDARPRQHGSGPHRRALTHALAWNQLHTNQCHNKQGAHHGQS